MAGSQEMATTRVVVTLEVSPDETSPTKTVEEFPMRTLILDEQNPTAFIGRASKEPAKGLIPAADNAWFMSPVISRKHAEILANFVERKVYIRDIGASHGTFINSMQDGPIGTSGPMLSQGGEFQELINDSKITLGVMIARIDKTFYPTILRVNIEHNPQNRARNSGQTTAPGSTYAAPEYIDEDSSDEEVEEKEEEEDDDDDEKKEQQDRDSPAASLLPTKSSKENVVDLTTDSDSDCQRGSLDKVIDLTSPPLPRSPASPPASLTRNDGEDSSPIQVAKNQFATNQTAGKYHGQPHTESLMDEEEKAAALKTGGEDASDDGSFFIDEDDGSYSDLEKESNSGNSEFTDNFDMESDDNDDERLDEKIEDMDHDSSDEELGHRHGYDAEYSADEDVLDENDPDTNLWRHRGSECNSICGEYMIPVAYQPDVYPHWEPAVDAPTPQPSAPTRQSIPVAQLVNPTNQSAREDQISETHSFINATPKPQERGVPSAAVLGSSVGVPGDRPVGPGYRSSLQEYVPRPPSNASHATNIVDPWTGVSAFEKVAAEPAVTTEAAKNLNEREGDNDDDDDMPLGARDLRKKRMEQVAARSLEDRMVQPAARGLDDTPMEPGPEEQSSSVRQSKIRKEQRSAELRQFIMGSPFKLPALSTGPRARIQAMPGPTNTHTAAVAKGKRKSDEISTLTLEEQTWEASLSNKIVEAAKAMAARAAEDASRRVSFNSTMAEAGDTLAPLASHWLFDSASQQLSHKCEGSVSSDLPVPPSSGKIPAAAELAVVEETQATKPSIELPAQTVAQTPALTQTPTVAQTPALTQTPNVAQTPAVVQVPALVAAPAEPNSGMHSAKRQKIRHIAERLGYAALGGVSVGAAIVTTLICTAPTF